MEKEIDTHRKQQEKQIMTSMIMLCFNEPFNLDLKARKSSETCSFFSYVHIQIVLRSK